MSDRKPVLTMAEADEVIEMHASGSTGSRNALRALFARAIEERTEMLAALVAIKADKFGDPKPCGHEFDCLCAGDLLVAVLKKAEAPHE